MKKTLIASAIAAATAFSGAAAAAEMPTVYGNIQYALVYDNVDGGDSSIDHRDNGSTLGVKHSHEIAPGIEGFFKAEMEFTADQKGGGNGLTDLDEAYIGVKSDDFGKVWVGSDDSTYERAIDTIANFYEAADLSIGGDYETGEGDLVQYETPSFGGLTLGAAVQINGDANGGAKSYPYQLAAIYSVDALEVAFAVDSNDVAADGNNENTYGLRGTYTAGDLSVTGEYQTRKDVGDLYGVMGVYTMGANQFALSYEMGVADDANDTEMNTVTLQALHNLSDNMYVYVEGYLGGGDDGVYGVADKSEESVGVVGAVYYF
ncbi:MAG: porin [Gammaproteobacteria bacterium]|uniref:Outer membrane protein (Porin) n=1 Tax=Marinobacter nitratireducens TaxID=1137280 RepID=A0A072MWZ5_9GAMM|nr:porin [Marinobacter nitratireducens]KEF29786.1 Outer membrane protein (porin) [Marinobacter nitratireducens]TNE78956.1 MAG: porin [Gammaproteobacteria bacterium]